MKYRKPIMEIEWQDKEDVICTSTLETDPSKPFPGDGEDGEDW